MKLIKKILLLALLFSLSLNATGLTLTDEEKAYLSQRKSLSLCIDPSWMPFEGIENGNHIGVSSEYVHIISQKIDKPMELIVTDSWSDSVSALKDGRCDFLPLAMKNSKSEEHLIFSKPYIKFSLSIVTKNRNLFYTDVADIVGKKVGMVKEYEFIDMLRKKYPSLDLVEVDNIEKGLQRVESGNLFGIIDSIGTLGYAIQEGRFSALRVSGKFKEEWLLSVAVRKRENILLSIFEKALLKITNKQKKEAYNKWVTVQYNEHVDYTLFFQASGVLVLLFLFLFYRNYELKKYNEQLEILSTTDRLTGISNRLKLDDTLEHEKNLFDRFYDPLSIILFDIDDFKKINDNHGHKIGDKVLQNIAKVIQKNKRKMDVFGRWGGEEFLIICHGTNLDGALELAEKFRKKIDSFEFIHKESLSASFGVAEFKKGETIEQFFIRTDKALYEAKKSGKNRVETA